LKPTHLHLAALLLAGAACTRSEAPALTLTAPVPTSGKRTAPVTVTARLTPGLAQLSFRFEAAAEGVTLGARGLDGLEVRAPAVAAARGYAAGETASLEVPLASAAGTLAVFVEGAFAGRPMTRAVTFVVGAPAAAATRAAPAGVVETDQGPLKVMPVSPGR
jgi:hypothetical protein